MSSEGLWFCRKSLASYHLSSQADYRQVLRACAPQCPEAGDDGACRHLPEFNSIIRSLEGSWADHPVALSKLLVVLSERVSSCDACSAAIASLLSKTVAAVDGTWEELKLGTDPFKQSIVAPRGQKRRHDECYKRKLMADILQERKVVTQTPIANVDDIATTTWKRWQKGDLCNHRRAMVRELAGGLGSYHVAEDGTRLGRPAREYQFYQIVHIRSEGSVTSMLPPQAFEHHIPNLCHDGSPTKKCGLISLCYLFVQYICCNSFRAIQLQYNCCTAIELSELNPPQ